MVGGEADPVLSTPAVDQEKAQVEAMDKAGCRDQEGKV